LIRLSFPILPDHNRRHLHNSKLVNPMSDNIAVGFRASFLALVALSAFIFVLVAIFALLALCLWLSTVHNVFWEPS
jgi:hypothetical protein